VPVFQDGEIVWLT